ncbi:hypothetical protein N7463_008965 [Penicillium fimorum]|uniref:T6SS Phospholipase effector Tle1-like catalytic domain-containing protein n=1 Tax=Penicillium fimorum TaxID=1882269 RepID=A0A9W9XPY6_9EURO|nr:hypothetical protein N7463_008965 [Penicillium fimorum]
MEEVTDTKEFVLCFDGTGYKFRGDESDSNVLKIYRMLDRNDKSQLHYYQPGIGTNTRSVSQSNDAHANPIKRWYAKAKDAAFGSTFDDHVMAGYRYLMRFYSPGDGIYIFGFSRGAYVARLLAEMLDHIGLLEAGNEGKVSYVWSVFSKWGARSNSRDVSQKEKDALFQYMKALRETFCRPISQIRFLGLFDTVNSIPHFEKFRNKFAFPYTTRTSAKVIRHAVSIDEHRAKFRQDLLADTNPVSVSARARSSDHQAQNVHSIHPQGIHLDQNSRIKGRRAPMDESPRQENSKENVFYRPTPCTHSQSMKTNGQPMGTKPQSVTPMQPMTANSTIPASGSTVVPEQLPASPRTPYDTASGKFEDATQDIEEVWFPGCHADIGGGLELDKDEDWALSHVPLVWMIHEAQRAGLQFDSEKLKQFHCFDDSIAGDIQHCQRHRAAEQKVTRNEGETDERSEFEYALWRASTNGQIHDSLRFHHGDTWLSVLSWKMVEYLPFRRMILKSDQTWKPIRFPLPLGERRDIPRDAAVHGSAIHRMEVNSTYRPKNMAPKGKGKGEISGHQAEGWEMHAHHGCPVRETYRRTQPMRA